MSDQPERGGGGQRSRTPSRVPPHNLDAEESALGAALVSVDAAATIVDRLTAADFYKPAHRHVFAAIAETFADGDRVDTVTVSDRLRSDGLLDEAGGTTYLHELQNRTPSISAAASYARIVRDTATLRRMIYAASDLAEAAYNETDPLAALAKAQDTLGRLAVDEVDASTIDVADIAALLETDLEAEQGTFLTRADGVALIYAGKTHVLQAEPTSGKSWIALEIVREVLEMGGAAVYLDFEDTPSGILRRLRNLGAPAAAMRDRLVYARPVGKHGPAEARQLTRILDQVNPDLVVIDGVGESLSRNGLSEDKADDVLRWMDLLPRPIADTGAAVVMIDHVAKDPEARGRWARGSGAKLGAVDGASYQVKVVTPFSRKKAGAVKLVVAKDRPGQFSIGETAALVEIEPHGDGELVRLSVKAPTETLAITDQHKPTQVMAMVAHEIETARVPVTAKTLETMVHAKPRTIHEAIARLVSEGYVAEAQTRPKTLRLVRPYHGETNREPPPDDDAPPALFDHVPDEPAWLAEAAREAADVWTRDPNL